MNSNLCNQILEAFNSWYHKFDIDHLLGWNQELHYIILT